MIRTFMGVLISAFVLVGVSGNPAIAQEKGKAAQAGKATTTVLAENEKVRVVEFRIRPGDVLESPPAPFTRVVRTLQGGTMLRTYPDGKTEKVEYKAGESKIYSPSTEQFTAKNIGKTEVVNYVVVLK